jgi:Ca-activated chloride channel family protein
MKSTALAAALAMSVAAALAAEDLQNPTFSTRVDAVRVDVLVTDRGRVIEGLTADDFEIFDNGVLQQVDLVSFGELPLNVILAFDMSESVAGSRLRNLRTAGRALIDGLRPADQAALITFSHAVVLASDLSTDISRVQAALDDAAAFGDTALVDAAYAGIVLGESDRARSLLIVFSDGLDTSSFLAPALVEDTARRTDTVVYAVSAGIPKRVRFLDELTRLTGGSLIEVDARADLGPTFLRILDEFRQRYLLSYSPNGVARGGWHDITVRLPGRDASIQARPGYLSGS